MTPALILGALTVLVALGIGIAIWARRTGRALEKGEQNAADLEAAKRIADSQADSATTHGALVDELRDRGKL